MKNLEWFETYSVNYCFIIHNAAQSRGMSSEISMISNEQQNPNHCLGEDCSNSNALAMELLQSCAKPSILVQRNVLSNMDAFRFAQVKHIPSISVSSALRCLKSVTSGFPSQRASNAKSVCMSFPHRGSWTNPISPYTNPSMYLKAPY